MKAKNQVIKTLLIHLLFTLFAIAASADEYHLINNLIGERASTLGGAYIGVSDDPSGLYYNPAGLIYGFENYISVSANSYTTSETQFKDIVKGHDYSIRSSGFIPSFVGFSQTIGKSKLAFGIIVPNSQLLNQDDVLTDLNQEADKVNSLRRRYFRGDTTYLFGPGFSTQLGETSSFGVSLLGSIRSNTQIDHQFMQYNPIGTGKFFTQETQIEHTNYGFNPKIGFQFMPIPQLALGTTLSRAFNLSGKGTSRIIRTKVETNGLPVTPTGAFNHDFELIEKSITVTPASPWILGMGAAYYPSKTFLVALDSNLSSSEQQNGSTLTSFTSNFALGTEWFVLDWLILRGGLYTDRAITPTLVDGSKNQQPHVDLLGATGGISIINPGSSFTLGVQYSRGSGKGQAIGNSTAIQDVFQKNLAVHLSGSYQL